MTSFHCLQVSFIRSCEKYSPNNFDVKNIDLYNIIMMFRSNDVITSFVGLLTLMLLLNYLEVLMLLYSFSSLLERIIDTIYIGFNWQRC